MEFIGTFNFWLFVTFGPLIAIGMYFAMKDDKQSPREHLVLGILETTSTPNMTTTHIRNLSGLSANTVVSALENLGKSGYVLACLVSDIHGLTHTVYQITDLGRESLRLSEQADGPADERIIV